MRCRKQQVGVAYPERCEGRSCYRRPKGTAVLIEELAEMAEMADMIDDEDAGPSGLGDGRFGPRSKVVR